MKSKWAHLQEEAIRLRKLGKSVRDIEQKLHIPRSTLSGWLRSVALTQKQKNKLQSRHEQALVVARSKAAIRHSELKRNRIAKIHADVETSYKHFLQADRKTLEIALAMLYLGEGSKKKPELGLGNSDPMIMRFYVSALQKLYGIAPEKLRVQLHLRADQDENALKLFWSKQIRIPLKRFTYVLRDKRTIGKPTYPEYMGVCYVGGGGLEIQRRLMYLATVLCNRTPDMRG